MGRARGHTLARPYMSRNGSDPRRHQSHSDLGSAPLGNHRRGSRSFILGGVLPALALPTLGLVLFSSTGRDDSYLTYWPAYTLANFGEIVNYNGSRLEQSSSLLQTLVLGGANWATGLDIPSVAYFVGACAGVLAVLLVWAIARTLVPSWAWVAALLAATSTPLVYWALSGMETTLACALLLVTLLTAGLYVTAGVDTRRPRLVAVVVASAAFILSRPEAGAVLICTFAGLVLASFALRKRNASEPLDVRRSLQLLAVAVLLFAAVTMARLLYFGAAFPQPVSAKATGHLKAGVAYVLLTVSHTNPVGFVLAVLAIVGVWRIAMKPTPLGVLVVSAALADFAFVVLAGGDWMEGGRFLVPIVVLTAILSVVGLAGFTRRSLITGVAVVLVALQIGGMLRFARDQSTGSPVWASPSIVSSTKNSFSWFERHNRVHLRDTITIAALEHVIDDLKQHVAGRITVASGQGGMVAYYVFQKEYGRATFIDLHGLATDTFARCPALLHPTLLGSGVAYVEWLANNARCDVPKPDVIVDAFDFKLLGSNQYVAVYEKLGDIGSGSPLLPGGYVSLNQFIAVRRDLASYVVPRHVDR